MEEMILRNQIVIMETQLTNMWVNNRRVLNEQIQASKELLERMNNQKSNQ